MARNEHTPQQVNSSSLLSDGIKCCDGGAIGEGGLELDVELMETSLPLSPNSAVVFSATLLIAARSLPRASVTAQNRKPFQVPIEGLRALSRP